MIQSLFGEYVNIITWLGVISTFCFFASLALIPLIIGRLPENYFVKQSAPPVHRFLQLLRYMFGIFLLVAGILMLFLPGQGLLTMVLGLSLLDFPGKYQIVENLLRTESIRKALNWIRNKRGTTPFQFPGRKQ